MAQSISNTLSNYNNFRLPKVSEKAKQTLGGNLALDNRGQVVLKNPNQGAIAPPTPVASRATTQTTPMGQAQPMASMQAPQSTPLEVAPTPTQPTRGLFESVLGSLSTPRASADQGKYLGQLNQAAQGNTAIGEDARAIAEKYGSEINRVGQLGAGAQAGALSTGTDVVGRGNAAIASQSTSQRMAALSDALNAELQGTGQQLTGQQQLITGLTSALGSADTQRGQAIQSAINAGTLAQPSATSFGQTVFDPVTGGFSGGSEGMNPQLVAQQLANAVKSGQMTYEQAVSSLGYAGGAGQQFLNQALGSDFNAPLSSATIGGQADVIGQLPALYGAEVAAEGLKDQIVTYLASNPGLNPTDLAKGNLLKQWIEGKQLTDPKYQTLFNLLNEYTNTLTPILGVGGSPTNLKTQIAQDFINAAASGQSIAEVLNNMQAISKSKLQNLQSGAMGGGVASSPTLPGSGGGSSGGGDFGW